MTKFTTFVFVFISFLSFGQSFDNENFESWVDNTAFIDPEGWITLNDLSPEYGIPFTVLKTTEAAEGDFAAHMQTYTYKTFDNNTDTLPSVLFYGSNIFAGINYPWQKRVKSISFKYKYKPNGIDSGAFYFVVGYKDKKSKKYVQNGIAYYLFTKKEDVFTKVSLPVYYNSNNRCDTVVMAFINSIETRSNRNKPGTVLIIDDIDTEWEDFPPVATITEPDLELGVYPNPVVDKLYIKGLEEGIYYYKLMDNTGKLIQSGKVENDQVFVETLKPGFYSIQLTAANGMIGGSQFFLKK